MAGASLLRWVLPASLRPLRSRIAGFKSRLQLERPAETSRSRHFSTARLQDAFGSNVEHVDLGCVSCAAVPAGQHVPQLYEALQRCGLRPGEAVSYRAADELGERVDVRVVLGASVWELQVEGSGRPESKRSNETWPEAALRRAKHVAAGRLLADSRFQEALEKELSARVVAKEAAAAEWRAAMIALPLMTDVLDERYISSGLFSVSSRPMSLDALAEIPSGVAVGVDVEGFDVGREDWPRAWLAQLAWCHELDSQPAQGKVLVLLVCQDSDMDLLARWMEDSPSRGRSFYFFDKSEDIPGIFRGGVEPPVLRGSTFDLQQFGASLHELVGDQLLGQQVRKHERMSESFIHLPVTQGVSELQVSYAAADAIATLLVGERLVRGKQ
ncbi:unnamed protein product [Polarella glacialis]|uniref:Uncharacterized protein n=1 Tax=Polarella glacialis TaxID=89957 RepID=A0A813K7W8_POLGL|nr:unnamed protein product [Polarella glacialis]